MRAKFYTVESTIHRPRWWNYDIKFHIAYCFLSLSGNWGYTYWCVFIDWEKRRG